MLKDDLKDVQYVQLNQIEGDIIISQGDSEIGCRPQKVSYDVFYLAAV